MPRGTGPGREIVIPLVGIMTVPGHVDATPPSGLLDGADVSFSMDTNGGARVTIINGAAIPIVNVNGIADTLGAKGSVVAPGAGAAIVTLNIVAGVWDVTVQAGYGTTADVIDNMELRIGATVITGLYVVAVANLYPPPMHFPRITAAGATTLSVNATAAGGAGSIFNAMIIATRVS